MSKKRAGDYDDGRVIAPMNVEGMPWYTPEQQPNKPGGDATAAPIKMTPRENMAFAFGVLKAVMLVTLVFAGALFLFILFCTNVWLK